MGCACCSINGGAWPRSQFNKTSAIDRVFFVANYEILGVMAVSSLILRVKHPQNPAEKLQAWQILPRLYYYHY
jgi:hypothetical protein